MIYEALLWSNITSSILVGKVMDNSIKEIEEINENDNLHSSSITDAEFGAQHVSDDIIYIDDYDFLESKTDGISNNNQLLKSNETNSIERTNMEREKLISLALRAPTKKTNKKSPIPSHTQTPTPAICSTKTLQGTFRQDHTVNSSSIKPKYSSLSGRQKKRVNTMVRNGMCREVALETVYRNREKARIKTQKNINKKKRREENRINKLKISQKSNKKNVNIEKKVRNIPQAKNPLPRASKGDDDSGQISKHELFSNNYEKLDSMCDLATTETHGEQPVKFSDQPSLIYNLYSSQENEKAKYVSTDSKYSPSKSDKMPETQYVTSMDEKKELILKTTPKKQDLLWKFDQPVSSFREKIGEIFTFSRDRDTSHDQSESFIKSFEEKFNYRYPITSEPIKHRTLSSLSSTASGSSQRVPYLKPTNFRVPYPESIRQPVAELPLANLKELVQHPSITEIRKRSSFDLREVILNQKAKKYRQEHSNMKMYNMNSNWMSHGEEIFFHNVQNPFSRIFSQENHETRQFGPTTSQSAVVGCPQIEVVMSTSPNSFADLISHDKLTAISNRRQFSTEPSHENMLWQNSSRSDKIDNLAPDISHIYETKSMYESDLHQLDPETVLDPDESKKSDEDIMPQKILSKHISRFLLQCQYPEHEEISGHSLNYGIQEQNSVDASSIISINSSSCSDNDLVSTERKNEDELPVNAYGTGPLSTDQQIRHQQNIRDEDELTQTHHSFSSLVKKNISMTQQPEYSKQAKAPKNKINLKIAIMPTQYPEKKLSPSQIQSVQAGIMKAIESIPENGPKVRFLGGQSRKGYFVLTCCNTKSLNWLQQTVQNLPSSKYGELSVVQEQDIVKSNVYTAHFPYDVKGSILSKENILSRLKKMNYGLNTEEWTILHQDYKTAGQRCQFSIDENSIKSLKRMRFRPFFGFRRVKFKRLTKV